jgi:hypothetical protein
MIMGLARACKDGGMDLFKRWCLRVGSMTTAATLAVLVPTMAWASSHPGVLAVGEELARRRPRRGVGGFGFVGACCCIGAVLVIVLIVVLIRRRKQSPPRPPQGY